MDADAFRAAAHRVVDVMADYLATIETRAVFPAIEPGTLAPRFPTHAPDAPEPLDAILDDYARLIEPNATHWQPVIHWFSTPPTPEGEEGTDSGLPPGGRVRMDDFFIPDNGYPVHDRPYLDGDQSFGVWEGPRAASTSVYGDAAAITLARMVTLDDEFLIPDGDDADPHLLTLDDDLLI